MKELGHDETLERALLAVLANLNLEDIAEAGVAPITDRVGDVVGVNEVVSLEAAGFMTTNRGVSVRLSDGSEFVVEIKACRLPRD